VLIEKAFLDQERDKTLIIKDFTSAELEQMLI